MKFVFVVTGIGQPYYEHKLQILQHNLEKLKELVDNDILLIISFYDDSIVPEWLNELNIRLKIIKEPNHVGSFIQKHLQDLDFDYIFLILDDVQLPDDFSFNKMITTYSDIYRSTKKKTILSCTLSNDSKIGHQYMVSLSQSESQSSINNDNSCLYSLRKEKNCEYFFYLMNKRSYKRYYQIINSYPKYTERMWGVDLLLKKYRISAYLCDQIVCKHFYSHGAGEFATTCVKQMKKLLKKPHYVIK